MTDIKSSKKIYDFLDDNISEIISKLKITSDDEDLEKATSDVLQIIDSFKQEKLDKAIKELKLSQEWDRFTVAFYGETNAGKSTIIESLRIYFKEKEKEQQQIKFKNIFEKSNQDINLIKAQLKTTNKEISENDIQVEKLFLNFKIDKEQLEAKLKEIVSEDLKKKKNSIFYKILSFMHFINIQKEIDKINNLLEEKKKRSEEEIRTLNNILNTKNDEVIKLKNSIKKLKTSTLDLLRNLTDGQIIGDGRSDFTKKSTVYNFEHNDQKFAFLDVPGIEGHERIVIGEISAAVKKAHAVFYVTSSSTLPQKGDENKQGTLEKIKEHLGSQTEVYTIFNKRINNPMQLNKPLVNDDEKESLKIVDQKMVEILGENYVGHKSVSAKVAFLALANCLLIESPTYHEQQKFLDKFLTNELLEKALFDSLCRFITNEMVVNTKQKIKKSNFNKASNVVSELIEILHKVSNENFAPLHKEVAQEVDDASNNIKNTLRKFKIDLESITQKALRDFKNNTRREIYKYIDENVSDDSFKNKFEQLLEQNSRKMLKVIPINIEKQMSIFQNSITKVLKDFKRRLDLAIEDYQTFNFGNFDSTFSVKLQIDNGIDGLGLAGSLMGAGATTAYAITALANGWNPIGWSMITVAVVAGAITAVVLFTKSIYKFFSDDYKRSEQKKSADENLEKIIKEIESKIMKEIESRYPELNNKISNIVDDLENIVQQRKMANEYIKKSHQNLIQIAKQIELEGNI